MPKLSLEFSVTCDTTSPGEELYICGNIPELGHWSTGIKLTTNEELFPEWVTPSPIYLEPATNFYFKVCIKDKLGRQIRWEELPSNRQCAVTSSVRIVFKQSNAGINYCPINDVQDHIPCRKITADNINELGETNSISSGWEQFDKHFGRDESQIDLVSQAKYIYQNWKADSSGVHILKRENLQRIILEHVFLRTTAQKTDRPLYQKIRIFEEPEQYGSLLQICHDSLIQQFLRQDDTNRLRVVHLEAKRENVGMLQKQKLACRYFIALHLLEFADLDLLFDAAQMMVVNSLEQLKKTINFYEGCHFKVTMISQKCFSITKLCSERQKKVLLYYFQNKNRKCLFQNLSFRSSDCSSQELSSAIEQIGRLLLKHDPFLFPPLFRLNRFLEYPKKTNADRFCIIVHCCRLSEIPSITQATLHGISNRSNIDVFILADEENSEKQIQKILPIDEKKMGVVTKEGLIYYPKGLRYNLYKELSVEASSIKNLYKKVERKLGSWIQNQELVYQVSNLTLTIKTSNSAIKDHLIVWMEKQIIKMSRVSNLPLEITKILQKEQEEEFWLIEVKPIISTTYFACKAIEATCDHLHIKSETNYIGFSLKQTNPSELWGAMARISEQKNIKMNYFKVEPEPRSSIHSISFENMEDILQVMQKKSILHRGNEYAEDRGKMLNNDDDL